MSKSRARKIRDLRLAAGVSQAKAAHKIGLHREHLCMIEAGCRSISDADAKTLELYLRNQISLKAEQLSRFLVTEGTAAAGA